MIKATVDQTLLAKVKEKELRSLLLELAEPVTEDTKKQHTARAFLLWNLVDKQSLLITSRPESFWKSAIAVSYFLDKGRFKSHKKLLGIRLPPEKENRKASVEDWSKALGPGFSRSYIQTIGHAGHTFASLLKSGVSFADMPSSIEVACLLYFIGKKNKNNELITSCWKEAVKDQTRDEITVPKFREKIKVRYTAELSKADEKKTGKEKSKKQSSEEDEEQELGAGDNVFDILKDAVSITSLKRKCEILETELTKKDDEIKRLKEIAAAKGTPPAKVLLRGLLTKQT